MIELESEKKARENLSEEEYHATTERINALNFQKTELFNQRQSIDTKTEKARYKEMGEQIKAMKIQMADLAGTAEQVKQLQVALDAAEEQARKDRLDAEDL